MEASFRGCLFLFATYASRKTALFLDEAVILPFTAKKRPCFLAGTRDFTALPMGRGMVDISVYILLINNYLYKWIIKEY